MLYLKNKKGGFTLIELLVVVAIISLLASVVLASLNNARLKGRDAVRASHMKQLQNAVELYYAKYGQYPTRPGGNFTVTCSDTCIEGATNASWIGSDGVSPQFLSVLPVDPTRAGTHVGYRYTDSNVNGRQSYTMLVRLEKDNSEWCRVGVSPGNSNWVSLYPPCTF